MFCLVVFLTIALIPTGFFNWADWDQVNVETVQFQGTFAMPQSPAVCYFEILDPLVLGYNCTIDSWFEQQDQLPCLAPMRTSAFQIMILTATLLLTGFMSGTFKLFQPLSSWMA